MVLSLSAGLVWLCLFASAMGDSELRLNLRPLHSALILTGHADVVTDFCFSKDKRFLATCGRDGKAIVWDTVTGNELSTLDRGICLTAITFSNDGKNLIIGSPAREGEFLHPNGMSINKYQAGGAVLRWNWEKRHLLENLDNLTNAPKGLAISTDGKYIACLDSNYNFFVLDAANFGVVDVSRQLELKGQGGLFASSKVHFSSDARCAIAMRTEESRHPNGNKVFLAALACWDTVNKKYTVLKVNDPKFCYAQLVKSKNHVIICTMDNSLLVYDLNGVLLRVHKDFLPSNVEMIVSDDEEKTFAVLTSDGLLTILESSTLKTLGKIRIANTKSSKVRSIVVSDKVFVLRGGFSYSARTENVDGIERLVPEPLFLETYTIEQRK